MTEREYNEMLESVTSEFDCDRCMYGLCGECNLQCNISYEEYMKMSADFIKSLSE